ncbi:hypothetical protein OAF56_00650 [Pirellulaceae bacterium]|nr:hypothetical protein [Pirellulaceae bacterium]
MKSLAAFSFAILFCLANLFWPVKNVASATKANLFVKSDPSSQAIFAAADLKPKEKIEYSYALGKAKFDAALDGIGVKRKFKLKNMSAKEQLFEFRVSSNITINPKSGTLKAGESVDVDFDLIVRGPDDGLRHSAIHVVGASSTTKLAEINNGWRLPFSDSAERIEYFRLPLGEHRTKSFKLDSLVKDLPADSIEFKQTGDFFTAKLTNEGEFASITLATRGNESGRGLLKLFHKETGLEKPFFVRVERDRSIHIVPNYSFIHPVANTATKFAIVLQNGFEIDDIISKIKSDNGRVKIIQTKAIGSDLYVECRLQRLDHNKQVARVSVAGYPQTEIKIIRLKKNGDKDEFDSIDRFETRDLTKALASIQRPYFPRKTSYQLSYSLPDKKRFQGEKTNFEEIRYEYYLNLFPNGEFLQGRIMEVDPERNGKNRQYLAYRSLQSSQVRYSTSRSPDNTTSKRSNCRLHDPFFIPFDSTFFAQSLFDILLGHASRTSFKWEKPTFYLKDAEMEKRLMLKLCGTATYEHGTKNYLVLKFDVDDFCSPRHYEIFRDETKNKNKFLDLAITKTAKDAALFSIPTAARMESFDEAGEPSTLRSFKLLKASFSSELELEEDRRKFEDRTLLGWKRTYEKTKPTNNGKN